MRRKPVRSRDGQHAGGEHGEHLPRTLGTFQLAMFDVGATIGTGRAASACPDSPGVVTELGEVTIRQSVVGHDGDERQRGGVLIARRHW